MNQEAERIEKVSVKEATLELKPNQETLRYMMQAGKLPIDHAFKKPNSKRWIYIIYRGQLDRYKEEIAS